MFLTQGVIPGFGAPPANPQEFIRKALDSTAATTGNLLIPQVIQPYITETNLLLNPWRSLIPRVPWFSGTFDKRIRTARGRARFVGDGLSAPGSSSVYASLQETLKIVQSKGQVSNYLEFAAQQFTDPIRNEVNGSMMEFNNEEAWGLIHGNAYGDAYMYNGLEYWTQSVASNPNIILANGATISTDYLDQVIDAAIDSGIDATEQNAANMGFFAMTSKMISKISSLKQSGQRFNDDVTVRGGFRFASYRGFPLVPTGFLKPNQAWTGSTVTSADVATGGSLPPNSTYRYFVAAVTIHGETLPSAETTQATANDGNSTHKVRLSWSAPATAGSVRLYKIYRTAAGGGAGTEVLYTVIPGCIYTQDSLGFGFMTSVDVVSWEDTGVRTVATQDTAAGRVTGALYTPAYAPATMDELAADEEEVHFVITRAPIADEGNLAFMPTGVPMTFMPLAQISDNFWFLLKAYECFVAIAQYQWRISRVKPV